METVGPCGPVAQFACRVWTITPLPLGSPQFGLARRIEVDMAFLYLHVIAMFAAVAVAMGSSLVLLIAARRGELEAIRAITGMPLGRLIPILYISGGLLGLATAISFGFNLLAPWLVIAYALFVILTAIGIAFSGRLIERLHAVLTEPASAADGELERLLRRLVPDLIVTGAGIALIVADMVYKPFS